MSTLHPVSDSPSLPSCHARRPSNLLCARAPARQTGFLFPSQHGQTYDSLCCIALEGRQNSRNRLLCVGPVVPDRQHEDASIPSKPCYHGSLPTSRNPSRNCYRRAQCVLREALLLSSWQCHARDASFCHERDTITTLRPLDRLSRFFLRLPWCRKAMYRRQGCWPPYRGACLHQPAPDMSLARLQTKHASSRLPKRSP